MRMGRSIYYLIKSATYVEPFTYMSKGIENLEARNIHISSPRIKSTRIAHRVNLIAHARWDTFEFMSFKREMRKHIKRKYV